MKKILAMILVAVMVVMMGAVVFAETASPEDKESPKTAQSSPEDKESPKTAESSPEDKESPKTAESSPEDKESPKTAESSPEDKESPKTGDIMAVLYTVGALTFGGASALLLKKRED